MNTLYPLKLSPTFKDYIWGGRRLKTDFGMRIPGEVAAEAWTLSCHPDGPSFVSNGELAGKTLAQALEQFGPAALGSNCEAFDRFPILIKLIDAKKDLSIQVHPSDEYALRVEKEYGKTEMWYVLDCEPGAFLYYGFKKDISRQEFRQRIEDGTILEVLNKVMVNRGDVFFIESGTLHAIGAGLLIAEIQQNSNTTYRVYDYNRKGADGNPRPLHVDKAVEVTSTCRPARAPGAQGAPLRKDGYTQTLLSSCKYFTVDSLKVERSCALTCTGASFHSLTFLGGQGTVKAGRSALTFRMGDSILIPAGYGDYTIEGACTVLLTRV